MLPTSTPSPPIPTWLPKVAQQLEAMRGVSDNWDGYNGAAPRPVAIDAAAQFLRELCESHPVLMPNVSPTRTGGVLFVWDAEPHELEVEISGSDHGEYSYLNSETGASQSGSVIAARVGDAEFLTLLRHFEVNGN